MPHPSNLLSSMSTDIPGGITKEQAEKELDTIRGEIAELQEVLYASASNSLLVIFQGLDGSGKDSTIKSVFAGVDPAGLRVVSFKKPTPEELAHDFLWRIHQEAPRKRYITVFNRSHYEDAVLPIALNGKSMSDIAGRIQAINSFEQLLATEGRTTIVKIFLHVSKAYQLDRMEKRQEDPTKRWKYDPGDLGQIDIRDRFLEAWDSIIPATEETAPWHIIAGDHKWYKRYRTAVLVRDALRSMNLSFPDYNTSNL